MADDKILIVIKVGRLDNMEPYYVEVRGDDVVGVRP